MVAFRGSRAEQYTVTELLERCSRAEGPPSQQDGLSTLAQTDVHCNTTGFPDQTRASSMVAAVITQSSTRHALKAGSDPEDAIECECFGSRQ